MKKIVIIALCAVLASCKTISFEQKNLAGKLEFTKADTPFVSNKFFRNTDSFAVYDYDFRLYSADTTRYIPSKIGDIYYFDIEEPKGRERYVSFDLIKKQLEKNGFKVLTEEEALCAIKKSIEENWLLKTKVGGRSIDFSIGTNFFPYGYKSMYYVQYVPSRKEWFFGDCLGFHVGKKRVFLEKKIRIFCKSISPKIHKYKLVTEQRWIKVD